MGQENICWDHFIFLHHCVTQGKKIFLWATQISNAYSSLGKGGKITWWSPDWYDLVPTLTQLRTKVPKVSNRPTTHHINGWTRNSRECKLKWRGRKYVGLDEMVVVSDDVKNLGTPTHQYLAMFYLEHQHMNIPRHLQNKECTLAWTSNQSQKPLFLPLQLWSLPIKYKHHLCHISSSSSSSSRVSPQSNKEEESCLQGETKKW